MILQNFPRGEFIRPRNSRQKGEGSGEKRSHMNPTDSLEFLAKKKMINGGGPSMEKPARNILYEQGQEQRR